MLLCPSRVQCLLDAINRDQISTSVLCKESSSYIICDMVLLVFCGVSSLVILKIIVCFVIYYLVFSLLVLVHLNENSVILFSPSHHFRPA